MVQFPTNAPIDVLPYNPSNPITVAGGPAAQYVPVQNVLSFPKVDDRGEIIKGLSRGIDNLQALGYGAAGLTADALGNKEFANKMFEGAQRNFDEAAQSPAAVANFTDIGDKNGYFKDAWDWFWGAAAESLPSSIIALAMSGGGALAFRSAAQKLATNALAQQLVSRTAGALLKSGAAATVEEASKQAVRKYFGSELGSYLGALVSGTAMEAGSNWIDDVKKYGIQNTAPLGDLGYGVLGGMVEAGLGPERQLVGKFLENASKKELTNYAKRGVLKNIGLATGKAALSEGSEEVIQQVFNQMASDRTPFVNPADFWKDIVNAGAAGAAGGTLFGVPHGLKNAASGAKFKAMGGLEESTQPTKSAQDAVAAGAEIGMLQTRADDATNKFNQNVASIDNRRSQLFDKILEVHNSDIDPEIKQQQIIQFENEAMALAAQKFQLENSQTEFQKGIQKELDKLDKRVFNAQVQGVTEELYNGMTPEQQGKFAAMKGIADQHAYSEIDKAQTRIAQHQAAIKSISDSTSADRANGWSLTTNNSKLIDFHEKQIADEIKYIAKVKKNYERALPEIRTYAKGSNPDATTRAGIDLYQTSRGAMPTIRSIQAVDATRSMYGVPENSAMWQMANMPGMVELGNLRALQRDSNHAVHQITDEYNKFSTPKETDLRSRLDASRSGTMLDRALRSVASVELQKRSAEALAADQKYARDFNDLLINDAIANGTEAGVVPMSGAQLTTDVANRNAQIIEPAMSSTEFADAMEAPRQAIAETVSPEVAAVNQYVTTPDYQGQPANIAQQRQQTRREQLLGAMQAWNAQQSAQARRDTLDSADRAARQQEALETGRLYGQVTMGELSPAVAGAKAKVTTWLKGILTQLPVLKDVTIITHSAELPMLPQHVQKAYKGNPGLIDLRAGKIYLFSDNIYSAEKAVRTLVHEGVAHFGLRSLMTPDQLDQFLRMVWKDANGTDRWNQIKQKYPDYNQYELAEEYIANIAEQLHVAKVDMPTARRAWTKIYFFLRDLLVKLGWINVTRKDIDNVILATVYHLVNFDHDMIKANVAQHAEWQGQSTRSIKYDGFYSPLIKHIEAINIKSDKQMPRQFWVDQIWPGGKLRQGLSEEEMTYFDDMIKYGTAESGQSLRKALQHEESIKTTLSKTEVIKMLNDFNDIKLEEITQGVDVDPYLRQQTIDYGKRLGIYIRDYLNTFKPEIKHGEFHSYTEALASGELKDPHDVGVYLDKFEAFSNRTSHMSQYNSDIVNRIHNQINEYLDRLVIRDKANVAYKSYTTAGTINPRNFVITLPDNIVSPMESHTDDAFGTRGNQLMWIRTSEFTDAEGKRTLLIEEIQSDRAQAGAEAGFAAIGATHLAEIGQSRAFVPWTPVSKSWAMLGMKRMIKFAAENGYDKIAWTPGNQQVERWQSETRKNVTHISWYSNPDVYPGLLSVAVNTSDGNYHSFEFQYGKLPDGTTLEQFVGKDVANKIKADRAGTLQQEDLTIGGHGFKQFYDVELVNNTKKYLKNLDPSVTLGITSYLEENGDIAANWKLHSFDITDTMRKRIENGQPAYGNVIRESRDNVVPFDQWQSVRESRSYKDWFDHLKDAFKRTSLDVKNGKITPNAKLTKAEALMVGLHDTWDRGKQIIRLTKQAGAKVTMDENFHEKQKVQPNMEAAQIYDFLTNIVGIDPVNFTYTAKPETLMAEISQLAGTNEHLPKDAKELYAVTGKVLQAMHAREANLELVRRQYKHEVVKNIVQQIEALEASKKDAKLTAAQLANIEKRIGKLTEQAQIAVGDIRFDLSGMSNEEADSIMHKYINDKNRMTWENISQKVQDINKQILDRAVEAKLLDRGLREHWDALYKNYVPLDAWEAHMKQVDPGFGSVGRNFDMSMWQMSKERKGNTGTETNPITLLVKKHTQLTQAIEQNKVNRSVLEFIRNHADIVSELFTIDDTGTKAREFAAQANALINQADAVLGGKNIKSLNQAVRDINTKISDLKAQVREAKIKERLAKSETSKNKYLDKQTQLGIEIQKAVDAKDQIKKDIAEIKALPAYADLKKQLQSLSTKRQQELNRRGFKIEIRNGLTYKVRKSSMFEGNATNTITIIDKDGSKVRVLVKDPHALAMLKGTGTIRSNIVFQALGNIQRKMAQLMTTYAPPFIAVNWFRDTGTALIHIRNVAEDISSLRWVDRTPGMSDREYLRFNRNAATSALMRVIRGSNGNMSAIRAAFQYERDGKINDERMSKMMKLFIDNGGYTRMYGTASYEVTQKNLEKSLKKLLDPSKSREAMYSVANMMQDISGAVENSTRLAAFTAIFEQLTKQGIDETHAAQRAASAALDLTVNFTKKGTWSPIISSLFLFSQASINSTVRIARAMFPDSDKGKPIYDKRITRYVTGLAAVGFILSMAARGMGGTDDDGVDYYDKLPDYVRRTNLVIAVGKNRFIRIPVAFGYQAFVSLGNNMADMWMGRLTPSKALASTFGSMMDNFSFVGGGDESLTNMLTPTVFKPIAQVYSNQNYFGGKVYPEPNAWKRGEIPDSQKYWNNTPEFFKKLALWMNKWSGGNADRSGFVDVSPAAMEYMFKQYTGGVGQLLDQLLGLGEKAYVGRTDAIKLPEIPIIARFGATADNSATLHEYSRVVQELKTQLSEYKRAKAEKVSTVEMLEVMDETRAGRLLEHKLNRVEQDLSTMKSKLNKLELANGSSSEEVWKKRQENEERAVALIKPIIRQAHAAGVK